MYLGYDIRSNLFCEKNPLHSTNIPQTGIFKWNFQKAPWYQIVKFIHNLSENAF